MAQVLMVASGKGGTGKSTFATFLSTELAQKGNKTLLIELDAGLRSIDIISGINREAVYDLADILTNRCEAEKAMIVSPYTSNLVIIPAPYKNFEGNFDNFKKLIEKVYLDFDYIVLDTAAGLGNAFYTACSVAAMGIIVVTPDIVSVRDGRLISDEINSHGIKDIRLIINKFSRETFKFSGFDDLDAIIDRTCARLLGVVPMSTQIAQSSANGAQLPVNSKEKQIFSAIAQRVMGKEIQIQI